MDFSTLNWLAIIAATISAFVLGGLWYSPILFGKVWMHANNFSDEDLKGGSMGKIFGFAFVWLFIMAINLALFLNDPSTTATWGAMAGFMAGFGWAATGIFVVSLFERRSTAYMLINGTYLAVALTLMGFIIGIWR